MKRPGMHNQANPSAVDQDYMWKHGTSYTTTVRHRALRECIAKLGGFVPHPDELVAMLSADYGITTNRAIVEMDLRTFERQRLQEVGLDPDDPESDASRMFS